MIILTGGAGFIGSCILAELNARGRTDVLIVDSLGTGEKWKNLVQHSFLDLVSKDDFRAMMDSDLFGDVEAVIHMGACSTTTERDSDYLYDNNHRYSMEVARFALDKSARFVYASSAATYGDGARGFDDGAQNLRPMNMYGYSKLLFDEWVRKEGLENACVGLRFFNVYGPNEYHKAEQASMVWKAYKQISETGRIQLFASNDPAYEDGGQKRDFVYVKDAVRIVLECMDRGEINGLFNLGSGVARTWNDLARSVFSALQLEVNIEYVPMPEHLLAQYQNFTQADMRRLRTLIPDLAFTSLEDGIADYVQGYLSTTWPYH
jgi:ADP-L-glycero-D-manno-heptose 6-epimerase